MSDIRNIYGAFGRYSADLCLFLLVADEAQLSRAAERVGLSQPRLSQRMKFLEESLGQPLFNRGRQGVSLTRFGERLYAAVNPHLAGGAAAFEAIVSAPARRDFVILTDLAFAGFRLFPVFPALCDAFSGLSISLLTVQLPRSRLAPEADLVISMGEIGKPDDNEALLFRETVSVVCSPAFKHRHPGMAGPGDIAGLPLVELTAEGDPPWFTWPKWFQSFGLRRDPGADHLTFNSYDHVIRSAEAGRGLALGWRGLVDDHLEKDLLVQAIPETLESDRGYSLRIPPGRARSRITEEVFEWIVGNV